MFASWENVDRDVDVGVAPEEMVQLTSVLRRALGESVEL
jgi:hypothetical protein